MHPKIRLAATTISLSVFLASCGSAPSESGAPAPASSATPPSTAVPANEKEFVPHTYS
ncbi:MAG: hypothetical protein QMC36_06440 [Patescibacteria group bacterium]